MEGVGPTAMIGISAYQIVKGKDQRTVEQIADFCTAEEQQEMHRIGLQSVPTNNNIFLDDMIKEGWQQFPSDKKPDCILIAHSLPYVRRSYCTFAPCGDIPTFYLSGLPCAIMHKAIDSACRLIQNGLYQKVMVIGADKAYSDKERVFFNTIMGDAVVLLLLERDTLQNQIISRYISTEVFAANGENSSPESVQRFRNANTSLMRNAIQKCMQAAEVDHINYFVTHTSNRRFWDGVAALCGYPREMFLDGNICNTGHMNSHDSFFHYFYWREQGVIQPGELSMLINPGFGGTQGCTLLRA